MESAHLLQAAWQSTLSAVPAKCRVTLEFVQTFLIHLSAMTCHRQPYIRPVTSHMPVVSCPASRPRFLSLRAMPIAHLDSDGDLTLFWIAALITGQQSALKEHDLSRRLISSPLPGSATASDTSPWYTRRASTLISHELSGSADTCRRWCPDGSLFHAWEGGGLD